MSTLDVLVHTTKSILPTTLSQNKMDFKLDAVYSDNGSTTSSDRSKFGDQCSFTDEDDQADLFDHGRIWRVAALPVSRTGPYFGAIIFFALIIILMRDSPLDSSQRIRIPWTTASTHVNDPPWRIAVAAQSTMDVARGLGRIKAVPGVEVDPINLEEILFLYYNRTTTETDDPVMANKIRLIMEVDKKLVDAGTRGPDPLLKIDDSKSRGSRR